MSTAQIIQFPKHASRLKQSDDLVQEWGHIQQIKKPEQRAVALVRWRRRMNDHLAPSH
jgi:hypothetical protein